MSTVERIPMRRAKKVVVATPETTASQAAQLMAQADIGSVIVKQNGKPLGIFTERDLMKRVVAAGKDPDQTPLSEVMTSPVKTCQITDNIAKVADRMAIERIRHLIVSDKDKMVGLISLRDVLSAELHELRTAGRRKDF